VTHAFFKALLFLGSGSVIHGMEHGVLHTGNHHVDPQDMFNMGGLKDKMPLTFWTFLIGGFALAGFPLVTAGFWSKDEILADAFANGHWAILITLSVAALMTAFYTMRQITLSFLGQPRTKEAEHAQETPWTMTTPLVVLAFFAVTFGWVGIPEHFPLLGGLLPNWIHEFVGGTLPEHPEVLPFSFIPLLISLFVALGGLFLGWWVYKDIQAGQPDPLENPLGGLYPFLKNKWYFDEFYQVAVVEPMTRFAEFSSKWMDQQAIDGILHAFGASALFVGDTFRNRFDTPVINKFIGDGTAQIFQRAGHELRYLQSGRIQQYMISAVALLIVLGAILVYILA